MRTTVPGLRQQTPVGGSYPGDPGGAVSTAARDAAFGRSPRLAHLDYLRGIVIVLMVLDHARDFFGAAPFQPEDFSVAGSAWFLTRWVTHFCAPLFVLLAGMAAFLQGQRSGQHVLIRMLWTRGLWLIALELSWVNLSWMFDWPWNEGFLFLQVLWVLGLSMLALALLLALRVPLRWLATLGLVSIVAHNLLDRTAAGTLGGFAWLWEILHVARAYLKLGDGSFGLLVIYPLVPWIGVLFLGYALGPVLIWEPARRRRFLAFSGLAVTLAFVALRALNGYGDPSPWAENPRGWVYTALSFLNTTKYPASLQFLCMTLGPGLMLLATAGNAPKEGSPFLVFGRTPLFAYLVHVPLLHLASRLYFAHMACTPIDFFSTPPSQWPLEYVPRLARVYAAWLACLLALYPACRAYGHLKRSSRHWVFKYL